MKIYVVTSGSYSDYGIDAIFSTKEKAESFVRLGNEKIRNYAKYEVEEWDLDACADQIPRATYEVRGSYDPNLPIDAVLSYPFENPKRFNGVGRPFDGEVKWAHPEERARVEIFNPTMRPEIFSITIKSFISLNHAKKIFAEKMQEILAKSKLGGGP